MKKQFKYIIALLLGSMLMSCEQGVETYNNTTNRIGFNFPIAGNGTIDFSLISYSFVSERPDVTEHTLWIELKTVGFVTNYDRPVTIKQIPIGQEGIKELKSGVHYTPFNDPSIKPQYVVKAGDNFARVPLHLLRDNTLKLGKHYITLAIEENEHFALSFPAEVQRTFEIADVIVKPKFWNDQTDFYFALRYSDEKYRFMIEHAPDGMLLDEAFFELNFLDADNVNKAVGLFLSQYFASKLIEVNKERKANKLSVLTEPDDKGKIVPMQFCGAGKFPLPYQ